jgi:hypothetical protein
LLLVLLYAVGVRAALIDRPFQRDPEGVCAYYGILARNYIRRPFSQTLGVPVQNLGRTNQLKFYSHHPPLVPLLIAGVYAVFGFRAASEGIPPDWQLRFSTVVFTIGCIVAMFVMIKHRAGERAGLLAAAIFAALPITNYYGGFPDVVGTQLVFFALMTIALYDRFWNEPSLASLAAMSGVFALAAFTDWVAFFLPIVLGIHFLATRRPRQWPWIAGFAFACAAIFFLAYGHIWLIERDWLWIRDKLQRRTGSITDQKHTFSWLDWLNVSSHRAVHLFTLPVLILSGAWMLLRACRHGGAPHRQAARLAWIGFAFAGLHIVIGRQGVYQHEWWWWPLAPSLAISSALVLDRVMTPQSDAPRRSAILNFGAATFVLALGAWSTSTTWRDLHKPPGMFEDDASHSVVDIGAAIRQSVAPDTAVMVAEKDETTGLWYYADRPLVADIWTVEGLQNRMADPGSTDLPFGFTETWHRPPQRFIFPISYTRYAQPLLQFLQEHYAACELRADLRAKFYVFDLSRPAG